MEDIITQLVQICLYQLVALFLFLILYIKGVLAVIDQRMTAADPPDAQRIPQQLNAVLLDQRRFVRQRALLFFDPLLLFRHEFVHHLLGDKRICAHENLSAAVDAQIDVLDLLVGQCICNGTCLAL